MRTRIVTEGAEHLKYEIRHIVEDARKLQDLGVDMRWENIGDPVQMGEQVEGWIRDIVLELVSGNDAWAYSPTRGVAETRAYLASRVNERGGATVGADDILFFNGLADAVDKVYDLLHRDARMLLPSPCYPTHSSNEGKRGEYRSVQFHLDPHNGWQPDPDEIRFIVKYNPAIAGIGLIHPDNPSGMVYPKETLAEIVEIARQYDLFVVADEIYAHICYNGAQTVHLSQVIGDVPGMSLRGISKEYPWPGARCGWIEFLNKDADAQFARYAQSILDTKMMEVCSTTLPQMSVKRVFSDPRYPDHLAKRAAGFQRRSNEAVDVFSPMDEVVVGKTYGAFYFPVVFKDGVLNGHQSLEIADARVKAQVEKMVSGVAADKRFVYYLMGAEGICVTPLSGFHSDLNGFRMTLLETDDQKRRDTLRRVADAIARYVRS
jgi:alanine-synthesizing transaminase